MRRKEKEKIIKIKTQLRSFFSRKKELLKDALTLILIFAFSALLVLNHRQLLSKKAEEALKTQPAAENLANQEIEAKNEIENEAENPIINTRYWQMYKSDWYGFELKYPKDWSKPLIKSATGSTKWEYRYKFRKRKLEQNNPYLGFDVVVYNVRKIKELSNTEEFPKIKSPKLIKENFCQEIPGHLAENENYPAEQIYIGQDDECYNPAYFYTLTRDEYIYNIVPILNVENGEKVSSEEEIMEKFPEFISVSSTFNLIDIKRPAVAKPKLKPKITAPKPLAATKKDSQGRRICAKKNDKPSKSDKEKKKHLDMECCLDPDEYPNPWCYYPPKKK